MWRPKFTKRGGLWLPDQGLAMAGKFRFQPCSTCCGPESCDQCSSATPNQFQVVIAGVANDTCADCAVFNDTWILTQAPAETGGCGGLLWDRYCYWRYNFADPVCTANGIYLSIDTEPGGYYMNVVVTTLTTGCGGLLFNFADHSAVKYDCANLVDFDLPLAFDLTDECDASLATCKVTSI